MIGECIMQYITSSFFFPPEIECLYKMCKINTIVDWRMYYAMHEHFSSFSFSNLISSQDVTNLYLNERGGALVYAGSSNHIFLVGKDLMYIV